MDSVRAFMDVPARVAIPTDGAIALKFDRMQIWLKVACAHASPVGYSGRGQLHLLLLDHLKTDG